MTLTSVTARPGNRRRSERRKFGFPAKIFVGVGAPVHDCIIADISETGAKLVRLTSPPPDEFILLIGGIAELRRKCRVVWRRAAQAGVEFTAVPSRHGPISR